VPQARNTATLPSSTKEHNKKLDKLVTEREPPDRNAPWWERRHWATMWSTVRGWFQWTTRPEITGQFRVEELHGVCFVPGGWLGKGPAVSLGIPECELQYCLVAGGGTLVTTINRPTGNLSVKYWIRYACKLATENNTALLFSRDTVEQAALAAKTRQQ
jgi:hypothetical protein